MDPTPHIPGKFVWFEHVSNDIARARAFYEPLFGWHVEAMPMGAQTYHMIMRGDQGIGGMRTAEAGMPNHWISYQSVKDVDAAHAAAVKAGAKVTMEVADQFWGDRYGKLEDPFGHHWSVATHVRDVTPEEMKKAMQQMSAQKGGG